MEASENRGFSREDLLECVFFILPNLRWGLFRGSVESCSRHIKCLFNVSGPSRVLPVESGSWTLSLSIGEVGSPSVTLASPGGRN